MIRLLPPKAPDHVCTAPVIGVGGGYRHQPFTRVTHGQRESKVKLAITSLDLSSDCVRLLTGSINADVDISALSSEGENT